MLKNPPPIKVISVHDGHGEIDRRLEDARSVRADMQALLESFAADAEALNTLTLPFSQLEAALSVWRSLHLSSSKSGESIPIEYLTETQSVNPGIGDDIGPLYRWAYDIIQAKHHGAVVDPNHPFLADDDFEFCFADEEDATQLRWQKKDSEGNNEFFVITIDKGNKQTFTLSHGNNSHSSTLVPIAHQTAELFKSAIEQAGFSLEKPQPRIIDLTDCVIAIADEANGYVKFDYKELKDVCGIWHDQLRGSTLDALPGSEELMRDPQLLVNWARDTLEAYKDNLKEGDIVPARVVDANDKVVLSLYNLAIGDGKDLIIIYDKQKKTVAIQWYPARDINSHLCLERKKTPVSARVPEECIGIIKEADSGTRVISADGGQYGVYEIMLWIEGAQAYDEAVRLADADEDAEPIEPFEDVNPAFSAQDLLIDPDLYQDMLDIELIKKCKKITDTRNVTFYHLAQEIDGKFVTISFNKKTKEISIRWHAKTSLQDNLQALAGDFGIPVDDALSMMLGDTTGVDCVEIDRYELGVMLHQWKSRLDPKCDHTNLPLKVMVNLLGDFANNHSIDDVDEFIRSSTLSPSHEKFPNRTPNYARAFQDPNELVRWAKKVIADSIEYEGGSVTESPQRIFIKYASKKLGENYAIVFDKRTKKVYLAWAPVGKKLKYPPVEDVPLNPFEEARQRILDMLSSTEIATDDELQHQFIRHELKPGPELGAALRLWQSCTQPNLEEHAHISSWVYRDPEALYRWAENQLAIGSNGETMIKLTNGNIFLKTTTAEGKPFTIVYEKGRSRYLLVWESGESLPVPVADAYNEDDDADEPPPIPDDEDEPIELDDPNRIRFNSLNTQLLLPGSCLYIRTTRHIFEYTIADVKDDGIAISFVRSTRVINHATEGICAESYERNHYQFPHSNLIVDPNNKSGNVLASGGTIYGIMVLTPDAQAEFPPELLSMDTSS